MSAEVQYSASVETERVIASLGRTEDVQFSPSNRRLAVAAFHRNRIAVFEVEISRSAGKPQVALTGVVEIAAETLKGPHGLCFLDEDTLVVANREGAVEVYGVPAHGAATNGDPIPRRLGRGRIDRSFRRRLTWWTGENLRVSSLLLPGPSRDFHRELASDQSAHGCLHVDQTRELGKSIRARLDFSQRLRPAQHQDTQHCARGLVEVELLRHQVLELHDPRIARLDRTDE
jgi:hypothetical protein